MCPRGRPRGQGRPQGSTSVSHVLSFCHSIAIEFLRFVEFALARKLIITTLQSSITHLIYLVLLIFILL